MDKSTIAFLLFVGFGVFGAACIAAGFAILLSLHVGDAVGTFVRIFSFIVLEFLGGLWLLLSIVILTEKT